MEELVGSNGELHEQGVCGSAGAGALWWPGRVVLHLLSGLREAHQAALSSAVGTARHPSIKGLLSLDASVVTCFKRSPAFSVKRRKASRKEV